VTRARNYAILGKYTESIGFFSDIIAKISSQMPTLNDKNLINEWNRLLEGLTREKEMACNMRDLINGTIPAKETRKERPKIKEEHSESEMRPMKGYSEDVHDDKRHSIQANFSKKIVQPPHEDDELYNRKEKEAREAEREQRDKDQR